MNMTREKTLIWLKEFEMLYKHIHGSSSIKNSNTTEIILCPSYIHIPLVSEYITSRNLPFLSVGSQDISAETSGAYTSQSRRQLKPYINIQ